VSEQHLPTPEEARALNELQALEKAKDRPPVRPEYEPYTGAIRGGGVQEWLASQRLYIPRTLTTMEGVLYVLTKVHDLTPRQADLVWNWLQPMRAPDDRRECEEQMAPLIAKAKRT
jgi:hypothetical protein